MEIVIKIPDDAIKTGITENDVIAYFECCSPKLFKTLKSAVVLPEHHGRLIDADALLENAYQVYDEVRHMWTPDFAINADDIDSAPTIIEADKGILEKINEKQDSLKATCKAWDEAISRDGYVD